MSLRGVKATTIIVDDFEPMAKRIATFTRDTRLLIDKTPYYYADPILYSGEELRGMVDWCWKTFGTPDYQKTMHAVWNYQSHPDYLFWFREEKHLMMFILRWS